MIYLKDEYIYEGEKYIVLRVEVTCCKDDRLFKQIAEGKWYDMDKMEPAPEGWNRIIERERK